MCRYKGSPPALQDVMGGHVALMFDGPATSIPMIKGGKLKAFAVSAPKRNPALPDVPTFAEQGLPADRRHRLDAACGPSPTCRPTSRPRSATPR